MLTGSDSGIGTDSALVNKLATDSGSGFDTARIFLSISDSGSGFDSDIVRQFAFDAGAGNETFSLVVTGLSASDLGTGSDLADRFMANSINIVISAPSPATNLVLQAN